MLLASAFAAEPVVDATRLYTVSSAEVLAMGGAGLGFATGANGTLFTPGAAANRKIEARSPLNGSIAFIRQGLGPGVPIDLGNLGDPGEWTGSHTNLGVSGTYRNVGIGAVASALAYRRDDAYVTVSEAHAGAGLALSDGRVLVGAGWRGLVVDTRVGGDHATFAGSGLEAGLTLNRLWPGWNLGTAVRTPVRASAVDGGLDLGVDAVALPWRAAFGVAWYDPRDADEHPLRVAADVVLDGAVESGVSLEGALAGTPRARGEELTVTPHLGVEATVWPERLKVRAGSYLEPARAEDAAPRFHGTTGFELRLFHFELFGKVAADLSWETGVDVAPRYLNVAWLGLGLWQRGVTGVGYERPS